MALFFFEESQIQKHPRPYVIEGFVMNIEYVGLVILFSQIGPNLYTFVQSFVVVLGVIRVK
jgi:hypothetical protein